MWLGEITTKLVTLTFCCTLMPRVEELLAGGDADVEDLDSDGQPFYFFVVGPCFPLLSALVLLLIHLQLPFFLFQGQHQSFLQL